MCINALSFGMSYDEFWHNGLDRYIIYSKFYQKQRLTIERDMETAALWNGYYVQNALLSAPIIALQPEKWTKKDTKKAVERYPNKTNWMMKLEKEQKDNEIAKPVIVKASPQAVVAHAKRLKEIKLRASLRK